MEQKQSLIGTNRAQLIKPRSNEPKILFQRKKNETLSKYDEILGPFYIDPLLMDKFRSPKKCKFIFYVLHKLKIWYYGGYPNTHSQLT